MARLLDGVNTTTLPQDPFLPLYIHETPSFLDTGACICSLRATPSKDDEAAWQCIGNQTQGIYEVTTGKWYKTVHGGNNIELPIYDASNGPDSSTTLAWNAEQQSLVTLPKQNNLTVYDQACTAVNQTTFSTAFYEANAAISRGEKPIAAAPCYLYGAVPMQLQNLTDWQSHGCSEGFLCTNNTVNSLPQYCPPVTACQTSRLFGSVCEFEGENIGMGPFEPVICQAGYYCPKPGNTMVECPAGTYCQPGAAKPTPCSFGSKCDAGSSYQRNLIPVAVLLVLDVALLVGTIVLALRSRFRTSARYSSESTGPRPKGAIGVVTAKSSGYNPLDDGSDHDQEMLPMNATYMPSADTWHGFHAVLDMNVTRGMRAEELERAQGMTSQLRSFVESMRKATAAAHFGLSFQYSNLSFQPKKSSRMILQNITGSIERGAVTAVMGGSGAGKSTFVNVLMGKTSHTSGTVAINGVPGKLKRYKKLIGYVPQDDIVLPELTVYENILHSARIRLPRTWTDNEVVAHVNSVIDCLELWHVRDSLVGTVGKPIISGGQRKRVSIGMELAAAPMAIFLDEPTSGLDATAASSIMSTLKAIARLGISVIVVIHQPRMEIFEMLDNLILLGNGQLIYEGPEADVKPFFESIGFRFPPHGNYGDVVTDIITGSGRAYKTIGDISKESLINHWASSKYSSARSGRSESIISVNSTSMNKVLKTRGASQFRQWYLCLRRAMLQQYRSRLAFWSEMVLASIAGFLIGLAENSKGGILFTGLYNSPYEILSVAMDVKSTPETALLVAIAIGLVSAAPGVKVFSEEMLLHRREAEAGHSRLAYFVAKSVSVFPRMVLGCLHFTTWVMLLAVPIIPWGAAFLVNLLYFYCIYGLASFLSMMLRREDAPLFATMISLIVGVLCGAAPPLAKVKEWHLEWLWRASPGVWLAEVYFGHMVAPFAYLYNVKLAADITGYYLDHFWLNLAVLFAIGTVYRVFAFIALFAGKRLRL